MNRVLALVEGQTEQAFVKEVVAPWLAPKGVMLTARLIGKPGHKGGAQSWQRIRSEILELLAEDKARSCTTMFDYYGFPSDFPGLKRAKRNPFRVAVKYLEESIHAEICAAATKRFNPRRFIPYIQLHEFEALLFSDTRTLAAVLRLDSLRSPLDKILDQCEEPEGIDDGPKTSPSKRLQGLSKLYQKVLHGTAAAKSIGLERIRTACPHFNDWVGRLERLAPRP